MASGVGAAYIVFVKRIFSQGERGGGGLQVHNYEYLGGSRDLIS